MTRQTTSGDPGRRRVHASDGARNEVVLDAEIGEPIRDPFGLIRGAARASAKIDGEERDLAWKQALEAGAPSSVRHGV